MGTFGTRVNGGEAWIVSAALWLTAAALLPPAAPPITGAR
ncbi:MAG: hypothetical protein JWN91_4112 [Nocardioides sp.]|jgi:hypothetical protein|nr:hypothetical protein [Nocardioides sp.]